MIEIFIKASSARWLKASLINMKRKAINTLYNTIRIQMFTVCTTPPPAKKPGVVQRLKPAKSNIYARRVAGLFFCLASTRCRAFLLPGGVLDTHKRLQQLFCCPCNYTAKTPKPFTGLYSGVSVDPTHSSAHNTAAKQAAYTPTAPRWRAYRQAPPLHRYQRYHRHAGRCAGQHSRLL